MATKLGIYNLALGHLNEGALASTTENRESRRHLDAFYDQVVAECLAEGLWNHAIRAIKETHSIAVTPAFGYNYAFKHPTDFVRVVALSFDPTFRTLLLELNEEAGYWYANSTPLYVRYISNSANYGLDLTRWPPNFTAWVAFKLAENACGRITGSDKLLQGPEGIIRRGNKAKLKAKSTDAMNEPPGKPPRGGWVTSRWGGASGLPMPGGDKYDD